MALLECVPNVSEGRRTEVLARLIQAVDSIAGTRLLDISSDPDHNRTVLTLAGPAEALQDSLLALYDAAIHYLRIDEHRGVHPRIGTVDVVPFVPLEGSSLADAVEAARRLGALVAQRFALPVYLYEEAATEPQRRNLSDLRRGGPSALAARMAAGLRPDFGPPRLHPTAGATVIGARFFLIAFNVRLTTADVPTARKIARAVRESGGGLPGVKAMGVALRSQGCAQVSLNLVDYRKTSLLQAFERVRREARARGTDVAGGEIVGLVPEDAVVESLAQCLQLDESSPSPILERRLQRP